MHTGPKLLEIVIFDFTMDRSKTFSINITVKILLYL